MTGQFDVTISIATYDRPALLERTIRSCLAQRNRLDLTIEILVTDNHPQANAAAVVERLAAEAPAGAIRYQTDAVRNMSALRNAGIKAAKGALVAFIDDDETADPDWLDELVGTLRRTGADIAVGPRLAVFAGQPPAYDPGGASFERNYDLPPDSLLRAAREDGKSLLGLGTGNSIFRADTCMADPAPFDLAFGNAGGEDAEFFIRLYLRGRTIAWAARARVTELVAEHRTTTAYRLVRIKREAQIYASIYLAYAPRPGRIWLVLFLKGLIQITLGAAITLFTWEFGSPTRLKGRALINHGLGKLTLRRPVGYIDEAAFGAKPTPSTGGRP